jgi:hypothetical protein
MRNILNKTLDQLSLQEMIAINAYVAPDFFENLKWEFGNDILAKKRSSKIEVKEMSAQDFKEEEHPRDDDGKFRDKNSSPEPSPDSGAWGGARKNAGRTSRDPIKAKIKLEERFRAENPNINDEELKQKIMNHGVKTGNPDLVLLASDPVAYQKKRDQEIAEAMATKPSKSTSRGRDIEKITSPRETSAVHNEIKTSAEAWKKEVSQAQDIRDAVRTFGDKNADELDVARARLTTAAATIATVIGLGVLYSRRPQLIKAGFEEAPGVEHLARKVGSENAINYMARENPTWIRFMRRIDPDLGELTAAEMAARPNSVYDRQIGAIRKLIAEKIGKKDATTGELLYPFFGPKATGFGPNTRYGLKNWIKIKTPPKNFKPVAGDTDLKGNTIVESVKTSINADGKEEIEAVGVNYINLALANKAIPEAADWKPYRTLTNGKTERNPYPSGLVLKRRMRVDGKEELYWDYDIGVSRVRTTQSGIKESHNLSGENAFVQSLASEPKETRIVDEFGNVKIWPEEMLRKVPEPEKEKFNKAAEQYRGYFHFFNKNILPQLSGRTLAMLTVSAGTGVGGGAYYFQSDIENYIANWMKQRKKQEEVAQEVSKQPQQGPKVSQEIALEKAKAATARAEEKRNKAARGRSDAQRHLEEYRTDVRKQLVEMKLRNWVEGAVYNWSSKPGTFIRRLEDTGMLDNEESAKRVFDIMKDGNDAKIEALIREIHDLPFKTQKAKKWWSDKEEEWKKEWASGKERHQSQQEERDAHEEKFSTANATLFDLITKAFEGAPESKIIDPDEIITQIAEDLAKMISDISQSCKLVVQSGMPTNSEYAQLNDIVTEVYAFLKDHSKKGSQEISQKGLDGVMASQGSGEVLAKKDEVVQ